MVRDLVTNSSPLLKRPLLLSFSQTELVVFLTEFLAFIFAFKMSYLYYRHFTLQV